MAIDKDGLYYLKKTHSTCRKFTNRNGKKIICNSDKSVCKTRSELSAFVRSEGNTATEQNSQSDIRLHSYDASSVIGRPATMVEFGGYSTPKCRLALSDDGRLFYHSTCRKFTNRNGTKIICNSNKSVCKTRSELSAFVTSGGNTASNDSQKPSWCRSSRLNSTEHTICSNDTLASLDLKLARVYGSQRFKNDDLAQEEWLRDYRDACGSDIPCLTHAYKTRIFELKCNLGDSYACVDAVYLFGRTKNTQKQCITIEKLVTI